MCFLAFAMLKYNGGFQTPKNTTPFIACLKYGLRLSMLIAIKHLAVEKKVHDITPCAKYERWFKEKNDSTFNTLCTYQHYASNLTYNEPGIPNVVWMDHTTYWTMHFKGHMIEFNKITTLFSNLETNAINIWETEVLMNLPLKVKYAEITDDMGNAGVGYSFFSNACNRCFQDRDILAKTILATPTLANCFLTRMVDNKGQPLWKITKLQKWLFAYS